MKCRADVLELLDMHVGTVVKWKITFKNTSSMNKRSELPTNTNVW